MRKIYEEYSNDIENYCNANNLNFNKLNSMEKCCNSEMVIYCYHNEENGYNGLLNDAPMPAVLFVKINSGGKLVFEQTEHTKKYLK